MYVYVLKDFLQRLDTGGAFAKVTSVNLFQNVSEFWSRDESSLDEHMFLKNYVPGTSLPSWGWKGMVNKLSVLEPLPSREN